MVEERLRIEPNNKLYMLGKGFVLSFLYQPEKAMSYLDSSFEANPSNSGVFMFGDGGRAYLYLGHYDQVIELLEVALMEGYDIPRISGTLAIAYFHLERTEDMKKIIEQLKELSLQSPAGSPAFYIAMIYAQMGEIDTAFNWLDKAYEDHEVEMFWLKVEPPFEPLHNDPRWQVMLEKVGFPD